MAQLARLESQMQISIAAQATQASALAQLQADALIATTRTASEQPPPAQQAGGQLPQGDSSSHPPALMPPQAGIRVHRLPVWATSQQVITALANDPEASHQDRLAAQDWLQAHPPPRDRRNMPPGLGGVVHAPSSNSSEEEFGGIYDSTSLWAAYAEVVDPVEPRAFLGQFAGRPLPIPYWADNPFPRARSFHSNSCHYDAEVAGDTLSAKTVKLLDKQGCKASIMEMKSLVPSISYGQDMKVYMQESLSTVLKTADQGDYELSSKLACEYMEVEAARCVRVATVNWSRYCPLAHSPSSIL